MVYLTDSYNIQEIIAQLTTANLLWIDTEVADYNTRKPRISLIQILANSQDFQGNSVYIFDVLDNHNLIDYFVENVMMNPHIEKIFHNAKYDIKFLGKTKAKNITCTWEIAKKIPYYILPIPNLKLKTLTEKLTNCKDINKEVQGSDWGQRPLTERQLEYAKMDPVYLAQVHLALLELIKQSNPEPDTDNLDKLTERYEEVLDEWKMLDSEISHLLERIKLAMQAQNIDESSNFKLSSVERTTQKVNFADLARIVHSQGIDLDFPITLTQKLQKEFGDMINEIPVNKEKISSLKLTFKGFNDTTNQD